MDSALVDELAEWIRIPSVSADPAHADDVRRAADWLCERLKAAGGHAEIVDWNGSPLAIGEIRASDGADSAPTVLCYGHFDVQPPDPLDLWTVPPFDATVEGEWLVGRGVADDKGQLFLLLKAAERLARAGELPVNLRFTCDGEEETGGHSIVDFLTEDERGADELAHPLRRPDHVGPVRGVCADRRDAEELRQLVEPGLGHRARA